jgi:hypothetical protein
MCGNQSEMISNNFALDAAYRMLKSCNRKQGCYHITFLAGLTEVVPEVKEDSALYPYPSVHLVRGLDLQVWK